MNRMGTILVGAIWDNSASALRVIHSLSVQCIWSGLLDNSEMSCRFQAVLCLWTALMLGSVDAADQRYYPSAEQLEDDGRYVITPVQHWQQPWIICTFMCILSMAIPNPIGRLLAINALCDMSQHT